MTSRLLPTQLIPTQLLVGNPERTAPELAPDGQLLAWSAPVDGVLNLWVGRPGEQGRAVTSERDEPIRSFWWAADGHHLLFLRDSGGDENHHVHVVDVRTGRTRDLTPFAGVQAVPVRVSADEPDAVAVAMNLDDRRRHDLYRVDLTTGEHTLLARNEGWLPGGWVVDARLRPVAALRPASDGEVALVAWRDGAWVDVLQLDPLDVMVNDGLLTAGPAGHVYVASSRGAPAARLLGVELATGTITVLAEDPTHDVAAVVLHPTTRALQLVAFERARLEWSAVDPSVKADLEALLELGHGDVRILGSSQDDRVWLVQLQAPNASTRFFRYDRERRSAELLYASRPALERYELADKEPFSFRSRDGLMVHGYLSFPPGAQRRDLPTVLWVHGGPWARDSWVYDGAVQFFANRGYLVVQINFRGSTGYGRRFVEASRHAWAGATHTDLLDGLDHLVENGVVDPERIAIAGGSYGGYAALVGATFTPDRFRCAVAVVAPSNLTTLIRSFPPYWSGGISALFRSYFGDPETDAQLLWDRSPLSRIDDLRIPLLLVHGANDPRVSRSESDQVVAALTERGVPHRYLVFEDEGHGFAKQENVLRYHDELERFLDEHLAPAP